MILRLSLAIYARPCRNIMMAGIIAAFLVLSAAQGTAQIKISGKVITRDSIPVKGAHVRMTASSEPGLLITCESGDDGSFDFTLTTHAGHTPAAEQFGLFRNYPNPFISGTTLSFRLEHSGYTTLDIFDILGKHFKTLASDYLPSGLHSFNWNCLDSRGKQVAPGTYLAVLSSGSTISVRKLLLSGEIPIPAFLPGPSEKSPHLYMSRLRPVLQCRFDIIDTTTSSPHFGSRSNLQVAVANDTSIVFVVDTKYDYDLIAGISYPPQILRLDAGNMAIIDTIATFERAAAHIFLSKDSSKLYISTRSRAHNGVGRVYSLDLKTRASRIMWDGIGVDLYRHVNGDIFTVAHKWVTSQETNCICYLGTIRQDLDSIVIMDSLNIGEYTGHNAQNVALHPLKPLLFAWSGKRVFFRYNYETKTAEREYSNTPSRYLANFILSKDGSVAYFANEFALDLEKDKKLGGYFGGRMNQYLANLAIVENKLYVTDPYESLENPASGYVVAFDLTTYAVTDSIWLDDAWPSEIIKISPDGERAFVNSPIYRFATINLNTKVVNVFEPGQVVSLAYIKRGAL
jgi:hypothetical protein